MGCYCSKDAGKEEPQAGLATTLFPKQSCGSEGPEVGLSAASWGFSAATVDFGNSYVFAAILNAASKIGPNAILQEWERARGTRVPTKESLARTLVRLQKRCSKECGIHGVLLVCLKQTRLVHMVRIGSATAVVGELLHGLNLQVTTGKLPFKTNVWGSTEGFDEAGISSLEYSELQLVPVHEHLILGTPELWSHIAHDDAVLRSHLYLKSSTEGPEGALPNSAAHLVLFALTKRRPLTKPSEGVAALVLTLRWPCTSFNQAFVTKTWLKHLSGSGHDSACLRALQRWQQLKMLHIEYTRAYRSMILNKWYNASEKLLAAGMRRARQVEETFWKTCQMVVVATPSLGVRDSEGRVLETEEIEAVLSKAAQSLEVKAYF